MDLLLFVFGRKASKTDVGDIEPICTPVAEEDVLPQIDPASVVTEVYPVAEISEGGVPEERLVELN